MTKEQEKRIARFEKLYKRFTWEYQLAMMTPSERKFYDPDVKRGK